MKTDKEQRYPWWIIPLLLLASFSYEYNQEDGSQFSYDGTNLALFAMVIISLGMVFAVLKRLQAALKAHNLIEDMPRSRFWPLLPLAIVIPLIGYRAVSKESFTSKYTDEYTPNWDFQWGSSDLRLWLVVGALLIIFLHTIIITIREIEKTALQRKS